MPQETSHAGKIRVGHTPPIVTLWMRGVVGHDDERFLAVPETDRFQQRVDRALGFGAQFGICARRVARRPHFAVRTQQAPIRRHLLHRRRSPARRESPAPRAAAQREPTRPRGRVRCGKTPGRTALPTNRARLESHPPTGHKKVRRAGAQCAPSLGRAPYPPPGQSSGTIACGHRWQFQSSPRHTRQWVRRCRRSRCRSHATAWQPPRRGRTPGDCRPAETHPHQRHRHSTYPPRHRQRCTTAMHNIRTATMHARVFIVSLSMRPGEFRPAPGRFPL